MGFLGFGNYSKPGKGVKKDEAEKKRFFEFFDIFSRKISKLIKLNLIFMLFCIPSIAIAWGGIYLVGISIESDSSFMFAASVAVAIGLALMGPGIAGLIKICRYFTEENPIFLFSDYIKAVKENFGQSFLMGIINAILIFVLYHSFVYYFAMSNNSLFYWIPLCLIICIAVIGLFANFYTYLVIVSVSLPFRQVLKNSISFAFLGMKTNFITAFFVVALMVVCLWWFPITIIPLALILCSFFGLLTVFNSFQYVYRYSIRPYYVVNNLPNPYEPEELSESIFEDAT